MKDCTSYCTLQKKYRKLSKTDCNNRVHLDCPKRLQHSVLRVFRKESDMQELLTGQPSPFITYNLARQRTYPLNTIEELVAYMPTELSGRDVLMAPSNIIVMFDGLCRKIYQYLGGTQFVELPTASFLGENSICVRRANLI